MDDFWQNRDPVTIVGTGGLGSDVFRLLAKGGYAGPITLIDGDIVEEKNTRNQAYDPRHVGMLKVDALCDQARRWGAPRPWVTGEFITGPHMVSGVVFLCVDKISKRRAVWHDCIKDNPRVPLFIEMRMDGVYFTIHALNPTNTEHQLLWERYSSYEDDEAENVTAGCGGPTAVIQSVNVVTGIAVSLFMRYVEMRETLGEAMANQVEGDLIDFSLTPRSWGSWIEPVDATLARR